MTRRNASLHMADFGVRVPAPRPTASHVEGRAHSALTWAFARARPTASQARPLSASPRPSLYREGRTQGRTSTEPNEPPIEATTPNIAAALEQTISRHPANHSRPSLQVHELDGQRWGTCGCGWTSRTDLDLEPQVRAHRRIHGGQQ